MRIGVPREGGSTERRVAATPDTVQRMRALGFEVGIEAGAGIRAGYPDSAYEQAGALLVEDARRGADILIAVEPPEPGALEGLREGALLISLLWPQQHPELVQQIAARGLSAIALDRIPRISRAQKMDVLSSMANIAGYRAVIEAAHRLPRFFGGQITAAGKTPPARVLIIGAGVAGLAAIGAARGLGAEVYAFDTRAAVKEQVESMGGRFLELVFEEEGEGSGGYARVMSEAFIAAEMALFLEQAPRTDIVITTALIPGKPAPLLWTREHVEAMPPGSVVVDMAAAQGGNCELTSPGEAIEHQGVTILGYADLTSRLSGHASQFFARNVTHLLEELGGAESFELDLDNEVIRGALVVCRGEVLPPPPPPEPSPAPPRAETPPAPPVLARPPRASGHTVGPLPGTAVAGIGAVAAIALVAIGQLAPPELIQHLTVFVLAVFIGWQVVWNVTAALHTPLMSVTNAISGIILVGGALQAGAGALEPGAILGLVAILFASINVFGGFLVTQRMLQMFRR
ncbi:MAG TPA: Re/Si-specific NAD(P)(+) transhydrogenase subunit alpha [Deltaproteobacteria bacterium]|nr:Re/Si-specific NAD(P)(+) transhydrogenase subunit alpha [Deltaproteobacteria bacterium]